MLRAAFRALPSCARGVPDRLAVLLQTTEAIREEVLAALTPATLLAALRRVLPFPASTQYTAVVLMPRPPLWRRLFSPSAPEGQVRPSPRAGHPYRLLLRLPSVRVGPAAPCVPAVLSRGVCLSAEWRACSWCCWPASWWPPPCSGEPTATDPPVSRLAWPCAPSAWLAHPPQVRHGGPAPTERNKMRCLKLTPKSTIISENGGSSSRVLAAEVDYLIAHWVHVIYAVSLDLCPGSHQRRRLCDPCEILVRVCRVCLLLPLCRSHSRLLARRLARRPNDNSSTCCHS